MKAFVTATMLGGVMLLVGSSAAAQESPKISLPLQTLHVTYDFKFKTAEKDGTGSDLLKKFLKSQQGDLYIDTKTNRLALIQREQGSTKVLHRKVFDGRNWYTLSPFIDKYTREPAQIDPLLELFQAHGCAPYPKISKSILGKEASGCEIRKEKKFYWENVLLEATSENSELLGVDQHATAVVVDRPLDPAVFDVPQENVVEPGELAKSVEKSFGRLARFGQDEEHLRLKVLARIDPRYKKAVDAARDEKGNVDWDKAAEKAEELDAEWAKKYGYDPKTGSLRDFLRQKREELDKQSEYYSRLAGERVFDEAAAPEALKNADLAVQKNPLSASHLLQRAAILARLNRNPDALKDIDQALHIAANDYFVSRIIESHSGALCALNRCDEALADHSLMIEHELEKATREKEQMAQLAEAAGAEFKETLAASAGHMLASLYQTRGDINFRCSRFNEAYSDYQQSLSRMPASGPMRELQESELKLKQALVSGKIGKAQEGLKIADEVLNAPATNRGAQHNRRNAHLIKFSLHRELGMRDAMLEDLRLSESRGEKLHE